MRCLFQSNGALRAAMVAEVATVIRICDGRHFYMPMPGAAIPGYPRLRGFRLEKAEAVRRALREHLGTAQAADEA